VSDATATPDAPEDVREKDPAGAGARAMTAAASGRELTPEANRDALAWLLSSEDDDRDETLTLQIDVGPPQQEHWIDWTIRPVPLERLRAIERDTRQGNRQQRRAGVVSDGDEIESSIRVIIEGTVKPDLRGAAKEAGIASPVTFLRLRFQKKPGLLGVISSRIMALSGYDADMVRLPSETAAAGNS
jgi:hypothetical protein